MSYPRLSMVTIGAVRRNQANPVAPYLRFSCQHLVQGKTLCRHGHHKWVVDKTRQFDVKQGRLVTRYRCARCGKQRVRAE